jgi:nucleotide-binding universal stress UspA family protein
LRATSPAAHYIAQQAGGFPLGGGAAASADLISEAVEAEKREASGYLNELGLRESWLQSAKQLILEGDAAELITELASNRKADLIAMSSHGRSGLSRLVFGSVADAVLRESNVPVLLTRSTEAHE